MIITSGVMGLDIMCTCGVHIAKPPFSWQFVRLLVWCLPSGGSDPVPNMVSFAASWASVRNVFDDAPEGISTCDKNARAEPTEF